MFFLARILAATFIALALSLPSWAQTALKEYTIDYAKRYQLESGYSIIYDNRAQSAKLKEFRVEFFAPEGRKIGETATQTYPAEGTTEVYSLTTPIKGFNSARLIVLSLHSGSPAQLPSNANAVLALKQASEYSNSPPVARNIRIEIEASQEGLTRNISGQYADNDGDTVAVLPKNLQGPPLSYNLERNGTLGINAHGTTGRYDIAYEVTDGKGGQASAVISLEVTLPEPIAAGLTAQQQSVEQLQTRLAQKQAEIAASAPSADLDERRKTLLAANQNLSKTAKGDVKLAVDELGRVMSASTQPNDTEDAIKTFSLKILDVESTLAALQSQSTAGNVNIQDFQQQLAELASVSESLKQDLDAVNISPALSEAQLAIWQEQHLELTNAARQGTSFIPLLALLIAGVVIALLSSVFLRRKKSVRGPQNAENSPLAQQARPAKPLRRAEGTGVIFPASPMQAANVAVPLSPAGQLTASNLQMLTGQYEVLRPAYHATGRIGYAQDGVPSEADYAFGTGFLITPNHVMTNRHVHNFYGHYLTAEQDCGGIEFIAEKGKDASDFIAFNGKPPILLEGLDIAIYTLSRAATQRVPIARIPIPTETLDGRYIAVVGYPDTHEPNNKDILAVVEAHPIFAVKRISQGQIFRHSSDEDAPYGVQVSIDENDRSSFPMNAICHNASTLSGNSGSPILDIETGELLGVHFAGHKIFNEKEAANLAMAVALLAQTPELKTA